MLSKSVHVCWAWRALESKAVVSTVHFLINIRECVHIYMYVCIHLYIYVYLLSVFYDSVRWCRTFVRVCARPLLNYWVKRFHSKDHFLLTFTVFITSCLFIGPCHVANSSKLPHHILYFRITIRAMSLTLRNTWAV